MRIAESKLRKIIRSVIKEASDDGADFASSKWRYGDYRNDEVKPIEKLCSLYRIHFGSWRSAEGLVEYMEKAYGIDSNNITDNIEVVDSVTGKDIHFSDGDREYVISSDGSGGLSLAPLDQDLSL